jgi:hypothetical protein
VLAVGIVFGREHVEASHKGKSFGGEGVSEHRDAGR